MNWIATNNPMPMVQLFAEWMLQGALGSAVGLRQRWLDNTTYRLVLALAGLVLVYLGIKFVLSALGLLGGVGL
jgi:hypothetical protein